MGWLGGKWRYLKGQTSSVWKLWWSMWWNPTQNIPWALIHILFDPPSWFGVRKEQKYCHFCGTGKPLPTTELEFTTREAWRLAGSSVCLWHSYGFLPTETNPGPELRTFIHSSVSFLTKKEGLAWKKRFLWVLHWSLGLPWLIVLAEQTPDIKVGPMPWSL